VASPDGKHLYTASKDGSLIKWDLQSAFASPAGTLRRLVYCPKHVARKAKALDGKKGKQVDSAATPTTIGHAGEILTLSISDDGEHLASGGTDRLVGVWDVADASCGWRGGLRGHKDTIAAVAFRKASTQAYTSAYDRTLKIFDLASLSYIETLFGHQDRVHDLDCLKAEMPLSAGGRDKTVRLWKVADESQLVFRAGVTSRIREVIEGGAVDEDAMDDGTAPTKEVRYIEGSTDCVAMIDDGHFLSGGDSGCADAARSPARCDPSDDAQVHLLVVDNPQKAHLHAVARPWHRRPHL
jgi:ribosomal RNA-processing protein 9